MADKRIGFRQILQVDPLGGTSYTSVGCIIDGWSGANASATSVETTCLEDTYRTYKRAQIDPGTFEFQIVYDPLDTTTQTLVDLFNSGDVASWRITFTDEGSGAANETFAGYVESFGREMTKEALVSASLVIKVTGDPGFTGSGE